LNKKNKKITNSRIDNQRKMCKVLVGKMLIKIVFIKSLLTKRLFHAKYAFICRLRKIIFREMRLSDNFVTFNPLSANVVHAGYDADVTCSDCSASYRQNH